MVDSIQAAVGIYLASFAIGVISGVFPLVNAELYLIGLIVTAGVGGPELAAIAAILACGQMVSHSLLFWTARGAARASGRRPTLEARIARARVRVAAWGNKRRVLLISSAVLGLPPFMLTCLAAGALAISYRTFVAVGLAGRIARFTGLAMIASLL